MSVIASVSADVVTTTVQDKPWGHEILFADGAHGYVAKVLVIIAGQSLSLQYHERKDETLRVVSGHAILEHGPSEEALVDTVLRPGDSVHIPPLCVHRITAVVDTEFMEVSTGQPGWREDVVRLADRYGRTGTSAP